MGGGVNTSGVGVGVTARRPPAARRGPFFVYFGPKNAKKSIFWEGFHFFPRPIAMDLGPQGPKGPLGAPRGPWGPLGPPKGPKGAQGAPWGPLGPLGPLLGGAREGSLHWYELHR